MGEAGDFRSLRNVGVGYDRTDKICDTGHDIVVIILKK